MVSRLFNSLSGIFKGSRPTSTTDIDNNESPNLESLIGSNGNAEDKSLKPNTPNPSKTDTTANPELLDDKNQSLDDKNQSLDDNPQSLDNKNQSLDSSKPLSPNISTKMSELGLQVLNSDTVIDGVRSRCELSPLSTSSTNMLSVVEEHSLLAVHEDTQLGISGETKPEEFPETSRHESDSLHTDENTGKEDNSGDKRSLVFMNSQFKLNQSHDAMGSSSKLNLSCGNSIDADLQSLIRRSNKSQDAKGSSSKLNLSGADHIDTDLQSLIRRKIRSSKIHSVLSDHKISPSVSLDNLSHLRKAERHMAKQKQRPHTHATPSPRRTRKIPSLASTSVNDSVLESAIEDIIKKGGEDFKKKYSAWIWDAFRNEMNRIKSLMISEFNDQLKDALDEREQEFYEMRSRYREKIREFEATSQGYQTLIDNNLKETQKMSTTKDATIDKLKKEFIRVKEHFEKDLHRQLKNYRREAEIERQELQKRNDELMKIMMTLDVPSQDAQNAFKSEIASLKKMVSDLTIQNEQLQKKLTGKQSILENGNPNQTDDRSKEKNQSLELQLEISKSEISALKKQLDLVETEKEDRIVAHHSDVATLNRRIQEANTKYEHKLNDAVGELKAAKARYSKEIKELKQQVASQEAHHATVLDQVRQQYGSKVEDLSIAVSQLKSKITKNASGHKHHHSSHHHNHHHGTS